MTALNAVAAATLRGLAEAILQMDFSEPMAFEQAITIGAEIERTAGKVVEEADIARFEATWGGLQQEADLHRLALAEYDRQFAELPVDVQAECKAKVTAELDSHVHPTFAQILASMRPA